VNPVYTINNPQEICQGGSYTINGNTYTTANIYYDTFTSVHGCDSTIVTQLIVNPIPSTPSITQNGNELISNSLTGNQWYNQSGIINGAITQNFIPVTEGDYYVVVTLNGCSSDPSLSINVVFTGIEQNTTKSGIKVYPNPVSDELIIETYGINEIVNFEIYNSVGQMVFKGSLLNKTIVQTGSYATGAYMIKLESGKTFEFRKIVKQ
jgi:hypothetical protein